MIKKEYKESVTRNEEILNSIKVDGLVNLVAHWENPGNKGYHELRLPDGKKPYIEKAYEPLRVTVGKYPQYISEEEETNSLKSLISVQVKIHRINCAEANAFNLFNLKEIKNPWNDTYDKYEFFAIFFSIRNRLRWLIKI